MNYMPLFTGLVEQSRSPGPILDLTLIQGKQENTRDGIQFKKKIKICIANECRIMENRFWVILA